MIRAGLPVTHSDPVSGGAVHGRAFNPLISLKALAYFDDVPALPAAVKARLSAAEVFTTKSPRHRGRSCSQLVTRYSLLATRYSLLTIQVGGGAEGGGDGGAESRGALDAAGRAEAADPRVKLG